MTLEQKLEVVRRFKAGAGFIQLVQIVKGRGSFSMDFIFDDALDIAMEVLRDFVNGKFTLKAKRKEHP